MVRKMEDRTASLRNYFFFNVCLHFVAGSAREFDMYLAVRDTPFVNETGRCVTAVSTRWPAVLNHFNSV
jgi:hypothetical protein